MTASILPVRREVKSVPNWIGGEALPLEGEGMMPLVSPLDGKMIARVPKSGTKELSSAVTGAVEAQREWRLAPLKERVEVMYRFKRILEERSGFIAEIIHSENGKRVEEAKAGLAKGIECVEYACSLPQIAAGEMLPVSRGVECKMIRRPIGVVAGITPFNFPAMVPWPSPDYYPRSYP